MKLKKLDNSGFSMMITLVLLLGITMLTIFSISASFSRREISSNISERVKSFYAADGEMVKIVQEMYDGNRGNYFDAASANQLLIDFQAEDGGYAGAQYGRANPGFTGDGFIKFTRFGQFLQWRSSKLYAGTQNLQIRYSNNAAAFAMQIRVNATNYNITFNNTGNNNSWQVASVQVALTAGINTFQLTAPGNAWNGSINIDKMTLSRGSRGAGSSTFGSYTVNWTTNEVSTDVYEITAEAFLANKPQSRAFRLPLKQKLNVGNNNAFISATEPTLDIPVTLYDFRSNRSNPEFECPHQRANDAGGASQAQGYFRGMVATTLDVDRKPTLGLTPRRNHYIHKWFRPWVAGDFSRPNYKCIKGIEEGMSPGQFEEYFDAASNEVKGNPVPASDRSFENITFPRTLAFNKVNGSTNGMYSFNSGGFFPLDGQGFGNEWSVKGAWSHNFSFTMEMHRTFVKVPGLVFTFGGDDDIWLFINNQLVLDQGGPRYWNWVQETVNVDALGLVDGRTYTFDFFYCERHSDASSCYISTNILAHVPLATEKRAWKRDYGNIF
jgi:fibro-slime domain-containing protein